MKIPFGTKNKGKSVEIVVLNDPSYAVWMLSKHDAKGTFVYIQKETSRLIAVFDSKPFTCKCCGCPKTATRFSLASRSPEPYWWCDDCSPRSLGYDGALFVGTKYQQAMQYAQMNCSTRDHAKVLIRTIAEAKGLPKRVGARQVAEFFGD